MRFAGHEGRKTECSKEGGWECNGQGGAVTDPPWSMRATGSWGCQSYIDARRRLVFVPLVKLKPKNFRTLEQWTRRRLRAVAWKQRKRGRTRFAQLIKRGAADSSPIQSTSSGANAPDTRQEPRADCQRAVRLPHRVARLLRLLRNPNGVARPEASLDFRRRQQKLVQ
jgi:hypothetical protein